jgi:hypothetical protein
MFDFRHEQFFCRSLTCLRQDADDGCGADHRIRHPAAREARELQRGANGT